MIKLNENPVFKYMNTDVATTVLVNQTLRWSSPVLFDDPLDVARVWGLGFPIEKLEAALIHELDYIFENKDVSHIRHHPALRSLIKLLNQQAPQEVVGQLREQTPALIRQGAINTNLPIEEINAQWQELIPQMRIICFSQRHNIIPLWATYGDNHKGVVMEFHPQTLTDSPWLLAKPVTYTDEKMSIASPKELARSALGIEKVDYSKIFQKYGATKKKNWSFQEELRVFSFKRNNEDGNYSDYPFSPSDLKAVYFGYKTPDKEVSAIMQLLTHDFSHVDAFRGEISAGDTDVSFRQIFKAK